MGVIEKACFLLCFNGDTYRRFTPSIGFRDYTYLKIKESLMNPGEKAVKVKSIIDNCL